VDGAHGAGHCDSRFSGLGLRILRPVSLHQVGCSPRTANGLVYVRRDKTGSRDVVGLMIRKNKGRQTTFRGSSRRSARTPRAVIWLSGEFPDVHQAIGGPRKERGLRYLARWWANRLMARGRGEAPSTKTSSKRRLKTTLPAAFGRSRSKASTRGQDRHFPSGEAQDLSVVAIKHDGVRRPGASRPARTRRSKKVERSARGGGSDSRKGFSGLTQPSVAFWKHSTPQFWRSGDVYGFLGER